MNVSYDYRKDYDKMDTWWSGKNKPNSNPIKPKTNPIQTQNKAKTNPIKPNFGVPYGRHPAPNRFLVPYIWCGANPKNPNGEGGIRTRGTGLYPYDGLANRCLKIVTIVKTKTYSKPKPALTNQLTKNIQKQPKINQKTYPLT